jgi:predicted extracellular nuclease
MNKDNLINWTARLLPAALLVIAMMLSLVVLTASANGPTTVFINELHYDNAGGDTGEAVEIAGPAGTDMAGWSVVFYNGNGGAPYATLSLSGAISDQEGGMGTLDFPQSGIQNGSPDGLALVDSTNTVIQFLSYEGTFTAVGGPADGMTSEDIGVSQSGDPVGHSLQLTGTGASYEEFTWASSMPETFGNVNTGQTFFSGGNAPVIASCGGPLTVVAGIGGSRGVSASDEDGIVTSVNLVSVDPPSSAITLGNFIPAAVVGGTATATVDVAATVDPDSYNVKVGFANNDAVPQIGECTLDVLAVPHVPIYDIQGTGLWSPYADQVVNTTGVVTAVTSNGRDMWIQDFAGDGNPATSDGIFVDDRDRLPDPKPVVGDLVSITAEVQDQQFGTQLPRTILNNPNRYPFEIISSWNPLPATVTLTSLPDFLITDGIEFWSPLEGMLVYADNAPVVAATSGFGEFAMLAKDNAKPGSGFFPQTQQIFVTDYGNEVVDYNPERILVDDATLEGAIVVKPGDRVRSLVGVVDYTFGNYKLQPTSYDIKVHNLPNLPASTRSGGPGNTVITTYNVENLFDLELNTPVVVDAFGQVGFDPGSSWGPPSTKNNTLLRMPDVCAGRTDQFAPFDPSIEWIGTGNDNFNDLGTHTSNCSPANGLIISEYIEGSSVNKALEIYNGTGAPVNLGTTGVAVDIYFNGGTSAGQRISLSGTLADGEVYVLANPGAAQTILDVADQTHGGVLWNGDDAIVLRQGGKDDAGSTPEPDELEIQLTKLALAIEYELELPEIIAVQEIENQTIAQVLADRVNAATGTNYVATSFETSDGRGIEPGFLWDANRVSLLEAFQLTDEIVGGVSEAFGPDSASPGREPIVGVFDIDGNTVTIVSNHFKSKGGDDPLFGVNQPFTRITEVQRKLQAQVVRDFVNQIFAENPAAMVMVAGDLNDFAFSEPGEGPDNPIAILEGNEGEVPLYNLIAEEKEAERFTFVFDGNSQILDHMLISPSMLNVFVAADMLHFDASYPSNLGSDPTTTLRASDHDPLEGRFKFK